MLKLHPRDVTASFLIGALVIGASALACAHVARNGGPAWLVGQELSTFVKFALVTAGAVAIDLGWKTQVSNQAPDLEQ
ncbi:MAG TPA: hypothetical protein VIL88_14445 [Devosia sp.]|uniref:hypothetical protein n=1 Tax=Devosia sp. TaxID=1871048 RepID=UPI002F93A5FD